MEKLRVAIIGTGGISHAHIRAWKKMPDYQVFSAVIWMGTRPGASLRIKIFPAFIPTAPS